MMYEVSWQRVTCDTHTQILAKPGSGKEVHTVLTSAGSVPEVTPLTLSPQHKVEPPLPPLPLLTSPKKSETKLPLPPKIHRTSTTKDDLAVGRSISLALFLHFCSL